MTARVITRATAKQLALYASIGIVVAVVDFSIFNALLRARTATALATSVAYASGVSVHFLLNRFLNFRNFERTIVQQARTYVVIIGIAWLVTIAIVEAGIRLGFAPFPSRVVAAILNFPLGYVSHRYLTFGAGIGATLRRGMAGRRGTRHE